MPQRPVFIDCAVALLLAVAVAALHSATSFGRVYGGDGTYLSMWTACPELAFREYHNTLYLPAARLCAAVLPRGLLAGSHDPLALAKSLSAAAAGIGCALAFLCARLLGAKRWAGVAGTALIGLSPALWFFGAAIEVHALHFAVVAFAALVTLVLPWQRPALATALAAVVFVLPCVSHQTAPLLGPGWILLVQCARQRVDRPFAPATLLAVGPVLLAAVALGHMLVQWRRGLGFGMDVGGVASTVGAWYQGFRPSLVWSEVLEPLGVFVPVAFVACCWRSIDRWLRACAAVTLLSLVAGVLWWGITERGGYLLGGAFLLVALAARLFSVLSRRIAVAIALLAIGAQAVAGWLYVQDFAAAGYHLEDRAARVRTHLGTSGVLLSCNDNAPLITIWVPGVDEYSLIASLMYDSSVDEWFAGVYPVVLAGVSAGPLALEASYRHRSDFPERVHEAMSRLEAALRRDCRVTEFADPSWPLLRVDKR